MFHLHSSRLIYGTFPPTPRNYYSFSTISEAAVGQSWAALIDKPLKWYFPLPHFTHSLNSTEDSFTVPQRITRLFVPGLRIP